MEPLEIINQLIDTKIGENLYYGKIDINMAYELRKVSKNQFDLLVVSYSPRAKKAVKEEDMSKSFATEQEALSWINEIKQDINEARSYHKAC